MTSRDRSPFVVVLWGIAAVLIAVALVRALRVEWAHLPDAGPPRVEDRRQHRFRSFTFTQAERMLRHLVRQSRAARTPRERALTLARIAALQQERGFLDEARAAGEQALQLAARDAQMQAEVRGILTQPLRLEDVLPDRSGTRGP